MALAKKPEFKQTVARAPTSRKLGSHLNPMTSPSRNKNLFGGCIKPFCGAGGRAKQSVGEGVEDTELDVAVGIGEVVSASTITIFVCE